MAAKSASSWSYRQVVGALKSADPSPLPADACALLSAAQVATVLTGSDQGVSQPGATGTTVGCAWNSQVGFLNLSLIDLSSVGAAGVPIVLAGGTGVTDVDVGDEAKIGKVGPGPSLIAKVGAIQINLDPGLPGSWPANKDAMVARGQAVAASR